MKKTLVLIAIFALIFSFDVFALEYKTVNITTTFSEDIEFSDIEKVKLTFFGDGIDYVDDAASITNIVELTKDNNYTQTVSDVKITDQSSLFAIVDKDNYGVYNCDISFDTSIVDNANINIHISRNNLPKNEFSKIPSNILEKIIGTTTNNNNSNANNSNNNSNNDENNNENKTTITTTTVPKTTVTTIYREELKKREEEKVKKKNNVVSIILFALIGTVLLIGLVFVVYKFITANK